MNRIEREQLIANVAKDYSEGLTIPELIEKYDMSRATVYNFIKLSNTKPREEDKEKVDHSEGMAMAMMRKQKERIEALEAENAKLKDQVDTLMATIKTLVKG